MNKLAIPHDAFVFVGDGGKALFLRNEGDEKFPNLVTERVFVDNDPPTREQGTDAPGRVYSGAHALGRSAVETTDWHEIDEHRFAHRVSAALEGLVRERATPVTGHCSSAPHARRLAAWAACRCESADCW
jgi:protein required for attachment to host cells